MEKLTPGKVWSEPVTTGRIVSYKLNAKDVRPMIITSVNAVHGTVSGRVFLDPRDPNHNGYGVAGAVDVSYAEDADTAQVGQWFWPKRH